MANSRRRQRSRTARRAAEREGRRIGARAEGRGRRVSATVEGYKQAAARSANGVAEGLVSRSNQRLQRIERLTIPLQSIVMPHLSGLLPFDLAVQELGGDLGRPAFHSGRSWVEHLAWGLDSVVQSVRLLLCLQPVGAAVIARTQLERWSANIAHNTGVAQTTGEDTVAWFDRLWAYPGSRIGPTGSQSTASPGRVYADLSELLHGRGPLMRLVWLDVVDISATPSSDDVLAFDMITDALTISLSRIRAGLAAAADQKGWELLAQTISAVKLVRRSECWMPDTKPHLLPLIPYFFGQAGVEGQLGAAASGYHRVITDVRTGNQSSEPSEIWPALAFSERRYRAVMTGRLAFASERQRLGADFRKNGIERLHIESVLGGEMAGLIALWLRDNPDSWAPAAAFALCSSALRSAVWLWLEDDTRAMGCLRPVIDQLARARTWRLKPELAAKLETSPKTTPRDWLEAAGWRRLNLVSRAFGEFVHGGLGVNHEAAGKALVSLQDDPEDELSQLTGRTHALSALVHYVQVESAQWLRRFDPDVANAFWRVIRLTEERGEKGLEKFLARSWSNRATPVR
jgi:hypothetical protein